MSRIDPRAIGAALLERVKQFVDVDTQTSTVTVEIESTTAPGDRDFTPISEIEVSGTAS